jgi:hypothetical protein
MVDYMIWPWFEYMIDLKEMGFVLNGDGKLPKVAAWCEAMQKNEAVQKTKVPDEILKKFRESVRQGKTNYDVE